MITKHCLAAKALEWSGLRWLTTRVRTWQGVLCLAYHRIGFSDSWPYDRGLWSASPDDFARQVGYVKKHFDVVVPGELGQALRARRGRHLLITFDDGYRDNFETAFPILRSHGVKATFFVSTGFIDCPRLPWWDEIAWMVRKSRAERVNASRWLDNDVDFDPPDRERAIRTLLRCYKSLPGGQTGAFLDDLAEQTGGGRHDGTDVSHLWMTWDMVRAMNKAGMTIGGHTVNHPILANLSAGEQRFEITGCIRRIETELGSSVKTFSYPVGGPKAFTQETRRCLVEAGIETAFSYYGGFRSFNTWDPFDIRRIAIEMETSPTLFRSSLALPSLFHSVHQGH